MLKLTIFQKNQMPSEETLSPNNHSFYREAHPMTHSPHNYEQKMAANRKKAEF